MSNVEEIRRCCHWFYTGRRVGAFARACQRMLPNWSLDSNEETAISGTENDVLA